MASTGRNTTFILLIMLSIVVFLFLNMVLGSVRIPMSAVWHIFTGTGDEPQTWQNIIWKSRFPQALTALVAGAGLSISGLQMQTVFRNPLAGPSVLGISSGASMGVAFVVLFSGSIGGVALSHLGLFGEVALSIAAVAGSLSVMALIVFASHKVKGNVTLLIIGVMIGYLANAIIGILKFFSVEEDIKTYVIWGLGSFSRVSGNQMMLFVTIMAILIPLSFLLVKTLNLLMLGDGYARNLGLNIKRARVLVITCSGVLTAIVTAYCGPIIFLGLADRGHQPRRHRRDDPLCGSQQLPSGRRAAAPLPRTHQAASGTQGACPRHAASADQAHRRQARMGLVSVEC